MQNFIPLEPSNYYHIYNCGINGEPIYREETNYEHFLRLYKKHVLPVADTHEWCLMGNHFHLLVYIRDLDTSCRVQNPVRGKKTAYKPHLAFSHLFNAYTQAFNKMYSRHGGLFERPFKRNIIDTEEYLQKIIDYIHNNPVHHGFCNKAIEYRWNSLTDVGGYYIPKPRHQLRDKNEASIRPKGSQDNISEYPGQEA